MEIWITGILYSINQNSVVRKAFPYETCISSYLEQILPFTHLRLFTVQDIHLFDCLSVCPVHIWKIIFKINICKGHCQQCHKKETSFT